SCRNGDQCQFRHSPAARSTEDVCPAYAQTGKCPQQDCGKRHTGNAHRPAKGPQEIQCRNEENGGVCTRPGCHFKHLRPQGAPGGNPTSTFGRPPRPSALNPSAKVFVPRQTSGNFEGDGRPQFRPRYPAKEMALRAGGGQRVAQQSAFATQARPSPRAARSQPQTSSFQTTGVFGASAFQSQQKSAFEGQQTSAFQSQPTSAFRPKQSSAFQNQQASAFGSSTQPTFRGSSAFVSGAESAFGSTSSAFGAKRSVVSTSADDVEMGDGDGESGPVQAPASATTLQPLKGFAVQSAFGQIGMQSSAFAAKSASAPLQTNQTTQQSNPKDQQRELKKQKLMAQLAEKKRQLELQKQQHQQQENLGAKVWARPTEPATEPESGNTQQQKDLGAKVWVRPSGSGMRPEKPTQPKEPQGQIPSVMAKPIMPQLVPGSSSASGQHIKSIYDILGIQKESPQVPKVPIRKRTADAVPASAITWTPTPSASINSSLAPPMPAKVSFVRSPSPSPSPMLRTNQSSKFSGSVQSPQLPSYEATPSDYASPDCTPADKQAGLDDHSYSREFVAHSAVPGILSQAALTQKAEEDADQGPIPNVDLNVTTDAKKASSSPPQAIPGAVVELAGSESTNVPLDSVQEPPAELPSHPGLLEEQLPRQPKPAVQATAAAPKKALSPPSKPSTDQPVIKIRSFQEIMADKRRKKEQAALVAAGLPPTTGATATTQKDLPPETPKTALPTTPGKRARDEDGPVETKRAKATPKKPKTPKREIPDYVALFEREMADIDMADLSGPLASSSPTDRISSADLEEFYMGSTLEQILS
ncbi:hypothetical protein EC988_001512, partial [Linderina pennispora]